jgi:hypothetical protein
METHFYFTIGILLLIIIIALAIGIYFSDFFDTEGFQSLNKSQILDMSQCSINTPGCNQNINYYDEKGFLKNGNFLNLPDKFYLDSDNILQPVPYGNVVTSDHRSYKVDTSYNFGVFSAIKDLVNNVLTPVIPCDRELRMYKTNITYPNPAYYPFKPTVCADVSYITVVDDKPIINYGEIIIPNGYYIDSKTGIVKVVPYGYEAEADKRVIRMTVDFANQVSSTSYNQNNFNLSYHTDASDISTYSDNGNAGAGKMWILDQSGNLVSVPYSDISGTTLYNEPGSFRFGSSNYVPNYEESVYLSKLTNISTVTPVINSTKSAAGFCSALYPDTNALEQACNALDTNACGSTSCCTLLGGEKCVYGSESGPHFKSNYSNFMVKNPEFYYYQGKCYGNCQETQVMQLAY